MQQSRVLVRHGLAHASRLKHPVVRHSTGAVIAGSTDETPTEEMVGDSKVKYLHADECADAARIVSRTSWKM